MSATGRRRADEPWEAIEAIEVDVDALRSRLVVLEAGPAQLARQRAVEHALELARHMSEEVRSVGGEEAQLVLSADWLMNTAERIAAFVIGTASGDPADLGPPVTVDGESDDE